MICEICNQNEVTQKHHVTYFPEKTMGVCDDCHEWIHSDDNTDKQYIEYKKGDSSQFYAQRRRISKIFRKYRRKPRK
jgi:ribosome-binding protein aMBF1 (putative translation factor)